MTNAKQTPRPWFIKTGNWLYHIHGGDPECSSLVVAGIRNEANAAFIVKTVNCHDELLEALKKLFELHLDATGQEKRKSKKDIEDYYRDIERQVRAAIAKATSSHDQAA